MSPYRTPCPTPAPEAEEPAPPQDRGGPDETFVELGEQWAEFWKELEVGFEIPIYA